LHVNPYGWARREAPVSLQPAQRKAGRIDVEMLVRERKQVRTLLLGPVKRRSLARSFPSGQEC